MMGEGNLRREVRLPIYWLVVGLLVMVVSPLLSIYASALINQRTIERTQAAQQQAQAKTRAEGLLVYCRMIGTQLDVYSESVTPAGKRAYLVWLDAYNTSGCQPPRK